MAGFDGGTRGVWGEDDVFKRFEFEFVGEIAIDGGFAFEDIEGGAGDAFGAEGTEEGFFVDDGATSGVYEERRFFHEGEFCYGDHVTRVRGERDVETYDVGALEELFEAGGFGAEGFFEVELAAMIFIKALHVETKDGAASDGAADAAGANDAEGFSAEIVAHKERWRPALVFFGAGKGVGLN